MESADAPSGSELAGDTSSARPYPWDVVKSRARMVLAAFDAPAAVGSFGVETSNNGAVSFVGGFTVQVTCNASGTVCATGGLQ